MRQTNRVMLANRLRERQEGNRKGDCGQAREEDGFLHGVDFCRPAICNDEDALSNAVQHASLVQGRYV